MTTKYKYCPKCGGKLVKFHAVRRCEDCKYAFFILSWLPRE